jgi:AcrR family transcriptional regulator
MSDTQISGRRQPRTRRRRSDGERSRTAILREAGQLATVDGISGLSIGRLADAVGMSKSGLFAHFGSKQELQVATIEMARTVFAKQVIEPALACPTGLDRLRQLGENFLRYVESDVYPGGCFFASVAAEMAMRPGPVRDGAVQVINEFFGALETAVRDGQAEGAIDSSEDAEQLAFELNGYLSLANAQFAVSHERTPIDRARRALAGRIATATNAKRGAGEQGSSPIPRCRRDAR